MRVVNANVVSWHIVGKTKNGQASKSIFSANFYYAPVWFQLNELGKGSELKLSTAERKFNENEKLF